MVCTKCRVNERSQEGRQRWCLPCRNKWEKVGRKKYCELSAIERKKSLARSKLKVYVRRGKIKKDLCAINGCGGMKVEGHHPNYDFPLDVLWLCRKHHLMIHKQ